MTHLLSCLLCVLIYNITIAFSVYLSNDNNLNVTCYFLRVLTQIFQTLQSFQQPTRITVSLSKSNPQPWLHIRIK